MRRYLIVADQALDEQQLAAKVQQAMAVGPCRFYLLVLAIPSGRDAGSGLGLVGAEGTSHGPGAVSDAVQHGMAAAEHGWQRARQQVAHELDRLRKLGANADGEAGEPHPMRAIGEALAKRPADEVILAVARHRLAGLVAMDLPHRIHRRFGLPVTVLGAARTDG